MADSLKTDIDTYRQQVKVLKSVAAWQDEGNVILLLRQRDLIQERIDSKASEIASSANAISAELLVALSQEDATVGQWSALLFAVKNLPAWRKSLNPPAHHWWWYPQLEAEASNPWLEWLLGGLTIALITLCLALARDISARFFTGAPGIWSSIGAIVPAALALFATGGALTEVGKRLIDTLLARRWKSPHHWPLIKFGFAVALTAAFFWGHLAGLPLAARQYYATGERQYFKEGKLTSAQSSFKRSLQLNPNFPAANHALALTYEDLRDFDNAKAEYVKAVNGGYLNSVSNLARLQIVQDKDYASAAVLLITALQDEARDRTDVELEYSLRKNLGWAWLAQDRLTEAEGELIVAGRLEAKLNEPRPDSYCLLAQVYEKQKKAEETLAQWQSCRRKLTRPEDDVWKGLANGVRSESDSASKSVTK
jgi:tetratricopeptide (TPR) repeat protein